LKSLVHLQRAEERAPLLVGEPAACMLDTPLLWAAYVWPPPPPLLPPRAQTLKRYKSMAELIDPRSLNA
jgi:hypothetical protein